MSSTITTNIEPEVSASMIVFSIFLFIIILVWVIAGVAAFITSIVCLGYNGSGGAKAAGILLAFFFGPFYWLYYIYNINYCTNNYYYPQLIIDII